MKTRVFRTPYGLFCLSATSEGLYSLDFPKKNPSFSRRLPASQRRGPDRRVERLLDQGSAKIQSYLHGRRVDFRYLKIDWAGYSPFGERVLSRLRRVSWGRTASYDDIAQAVGAPGASRAVGQVLRSNRLPMILPCHRIIRKSGTFGGFSRGILWKKRLLKLESACVDKS